MNSDQRTKHYTASMFVMNKSSKGWKILFVHHKKFDRWMIPGGHVEDYENPVEAVLRETFEETQTTPKLISFINREVPGTDSTWLLPPEFFFEQLIPARKDEAEHYHLDCCYVGVVDDDSIMHRVEESNDIGWFNLQEIRDNTSMFLSTQTLAINLLEKLEREEPFTYEQSRI
ncbi:MAG TPA: NUDIX domain-containing protein [Candidatus Saccharimonadales bacterium]